MILEFIEGTGLRFIKESDSITTIYIVDNIPNITAFNCIGFDYSCVTSNGDFYFLTPVLDGVVFTNGLDGSSFKCGLTKIS